MKPIIFLLLVIFLACSKHVVGLVQNSEGVKCNGNPSTEKVTSATIYGRVKIKEYKSDWDSVATIIEATNGKFTSIQGDIVVEGCEFENTSYESTLIDLNNDGNPEVIIYLNSGCMGGNTGRYSYLYSKNQKGVWEMILEDIGTPITLEERTHNWPEIYFAKAGHHYNLYKWNGKKYVFDRMHSPYDEYYE